MNDHTQNFIWAWIHSHQWWWTVMQFFTLFISVRILRLPPETTLWGRASRMLMLAGLMTYSMSIWNSGLSVPGFALTMAGVWLWVEMVISQAIRAGRLKRVTPPDWLRGVREPAMSRSRTMR